MGALKISNAAAIVKLDAYTALLNNGKIRLYEGTPPASCDTALTDQTLLAEADFGATAFGGATDDDPNAVAVANAISGEDAAVAEGTAAFARLINSSDECVGQGAVTVTGGGGLVRIASLTIALGVAVNFTSFNLRELEQAA